MLLLFTEVEGFSVMKMHQLFGGFDGMSVKKNKRLKYLDGWCGKMEIGS